MQLYERTLKKHLNTDEIKKQTQNMHFRVDSPSSEKNHDGTKK
jgi:hypothetical protein